MAEQGDTTYWGDQYKPFSQLSQESDLAELADAIVRGASICHTIIPDLRSLIMAVQRHGHCRRADTTADNPTELAIHGGKIPSCYCTNNKIAIALNIRSCFQSNVDFDSTTFLGRVQFTDTIFQESAHFTKAHMVDVAFKSTTFAKQANFIDVDFKGQVQFDTVTFKGPTKFSRALFQTCTHFKSTRFMDAADFQDAGFPGEAMFTDVRFVGATNFSACQFEETWFQNSHFSDGTNFSAAVFGSSVGFSESKFDPNATFSKARFQQGGYFYHTMLDSASFRKAMVQGVCFDHASFVQANFELCVATGASFVATNLSRADVSAMQITGAKFINTRGLFGKDRAMARSNPIEEHHAQNALYAAWWDFASWDRLRAISTLRLFAVSYFTVIAIVLYAAIARWYNPIAQDARQTASASVDTAVNSSIWAELLSRAPCLPIPTGLGMQLVAAVLLAVAATVFSICCPSEVQDATEVRWTRAMGQPLWEYRSANWSGRIWRYICLTCLVFGGMYSAGHFLVRTYLAITYLFTA